MGLFEVFSMLSLVPLISLGVFLPLVVYLVARWRDGRDGRPPDPQLGIKTALGFFQALGLIALMAGAAALFAGVLYETRFKDLVAALASMLIGGLFFGLHTVLLTRTNQAARPAIGHLYWGLHLIISGLTSFGALAMLIVAFGRGRFERDVGYAALSATLVYVPMWIALTIKLVGRAGRGAGSPPATSEVPSS